MPAHLSSLLRAAAQGALRLSPAGGQRTARRNAWAGISCEQQKARAWHEVVAARRLP